MHVHRATFNDCYTERLAVTILAIELLERTGGRARTRLVTLCGTRESRELRETGKREHARVATAWRRLRRDGSAASPRVRTPLLHEPPPATHGGATDARHPLWLLLRSVSSVCSPEPRRAASTSVVEPRPSLSTYFRSDSEPGLMNSFSFFLSS